MLAPATLEEVDGYWARFLGVSRDALRPPVPRAVPHTPADGDAGLGGYAGMYAQSFGGAPLVSLPGTLLERFGAAAAEAARGGLVDDERWGGVFGESVDCVVGPARIAYADARTFRPPVAGARVRPLEESDRPAVEALRRAVTPTEWEHGGSEPGETPLIGAFDGGALAAVAGYEVWGGRIAHLAIVTHPAHRRRRLGTAAVALAARTALDGGLIPQWRALAENTGSVALSRTLGFVPYAASLAVRLRMESLA